ncbi:MAG TPA: preprotein translocase subunit YajC [Longimicrobiales bacterium]|jgi:preprotein translocase subunit YajC
MMWSMLAIAAPQQGGSMAPVLIIWTSFILIFWLLIIRPQRKAQQRHQQMLSALKKGDEVMTDGGIIGEVVHIKDDRITLKTAENTRIVVARPKIARVFTATQEPERK